MTKGWLTKSNSRVRPKAWGVELNATNHQPPTTALIRTAHPSCNVIDQTITSSELHGNKTALPPLQSRHRWALRGSGIYWIKQFSPHTHQVSDSCRNSTAEIALHLMVCFRWQCELMGQYCKHFPPEVANGCWDGSHFSPGPKHKHTSPSRAFVCQQLNRQKQWGQSWQKLTSPRALLSSLATFNISLTKSSPGTYSRKYFYTSWYNNPVGTS